MNVKLDVTKAGGENASGLSSAGDVSRLSSADKVAPCVQTRGIASKTSDRGRRNFVEVVCGENSLLGAVQTEYKRRRSQT